MNDDVAAASARLARMIEQATRIVAFTGAGISTESGIPDFRSPGGIWTKMSPIDFRDFMRSEEMRRETWRRKFEIDRDFQQAAPNRGHRALAALHARGVLTDIITQNIDGLHQASGVPAEQVIELHGNGTYAACLDCGLRHELGPIVQAFERDETLPLCAACGGIVKSATISFGQAMPQAAQSGRVSSRSKACTMGPSS
jgi:NAD-dependent deacetylase